MLAKMLSSDISTYNKDAIETVFKTFTRKVINARIQEFLSAISAQNNSWPLAIFRPILANGQSN